MGSQHHHNPLTLKNAETTCNCGATIMKISKYLFSEQNNYWSTIARKLRSAPGIALFLDYDGTLTPIRRTPSAAKLPQEAENILQQLAQLPGVQVAIVTGRSLNDIRRLVRLENIGFAANHGFNIYNNGTEWIHPQAISLIQVLSRLHMILCNTVVLFPKVYIENKQFTLSIHYRNVAPQHIRSIKSLVTKTVHIFDPTLRITRGKKVLEVRPQVDWGKGKAVLKMLHSSKTRQRRIPLFIGDDATDEDVFGALRSKGITIRVGKSTTTKAQYFVKDVKGVVHLLRSIILLRKSRSPRHHASKKK
jgi:trehalose-phosphatase